MPELQRWFWAFHCKDCQHSWNSGYAWERNGQRCYMCKKRFLQCLYDP